MSEDVKGEAAKISHHLSLLREEYNKLQTRYAELQQQLDVLHATNSHGADGTFVKKILKFVAGLYHSEYLSDMHIQLSSKIVPAHRFILDARGANWLKNMKNWEQTVDLDWSNISDETSEALLYWIYKDELKTSANQLDFMMKMLQAAGNFRLNDLLQRCEHQLLPMVNVSNCVKIFVTAEETGAENLRKYCASLISSHWEDFDREDLLPLSAQSLYRLLEEHTTHPLHAASRLGREDVVFLDLVKYNQQLPLRLNAVNSKGELALDIALGFHYEALADCLVQHGASVDCADLSGKRLIHKAILRRDAPSCIFLLKHGALPSVLEPELNYSPLHLLAAWDSSDIQAIGQLLLDKGADPNAVAKNGCTPLHLAVSSNNKLLLHVLLDHSRTDLERQDELGHVPLWYGLEEYEKGDSLSAEALIKKGASCNAISYKSGAPLLYMAAELKMEKACFFLVENGADVNLINRQGSSALHIACSTGMVAVVTKFLQKAANANLQTPPPSFVPVPKMIQSSGGTNPFSDDEESEEAVMTELGLQSSLHLAVLGGHEDVVLAFVKYAESTTTGDCSLNFNLRNSNGETPLCVALKQNQYAIAQMLLRGGANVNIQSPEEGLDLLHYFILKNNEKAALFLLDNGAYVHVLTPNKESPLLLCIRQGLSSVLESLCQRGANMEESADGNCPLWLALTSGQEELSSILVRYGVDTDHWEPGPENCFQTLLHRSLDENNEVAACFLIRSGCDLNSPRRPGPGGDNDLATPLHMCATWGLENVTTTLLEHRANLNACDSEGKTPLHTAIEQHHSSIVKLLLQQPQINLYTLDRNGRSPFATALAVKNNKAAEAILAKDPSVAEQYDNKGRTLLHDIVLRNDLEGLLFLLSVRVNVNCRTSDTAKLTPLHLAVQTGKDEMIVRNLIVAGAVLDDRGPRQQTALHMAAEREDGAAITNILLDAGADWSVLDDCGNTALHTAARLCHVSVARVLLTMSQVDAESRNMRGQNPLHLAASSGREAAAALLALFLECMPSYPINAPDIDGNTPLLLAYMKGNAPLCKALVRAKACLATTNKNGVSIFNYQLATRQLLFRLLEQLTEEPPWAEYEYCMECGNKFGITTRKHHCRHCGRILCSKCSDQVLPIIKFNLSKPVRVCSFCCQVLNLSVPSP